MKRLNKILLVDDDPVFNFLTRRILRESGVAAQVDEALDGIDALEYITASDPCPDVILLDLNMTRMDGLEFLKEYEKQGLCKNHTHVFMLTSSEREEDRTNALASNFVKGYFDKPLSDEDIQKMLAFFS
jgi:CheY-like chemotaxis protein